MAPTRVTLGRFAELTAPLVGLAITRPWRGYGSALFLELGRLHPETVRTRRGTTTSLKGQATVMIEWSWRIERTRSILAGSWSTDRRFERAISRLKGARVAAIDVVGRLPELVIAVEGARWIHSFMTAEGQPEWTVFLPDRSWLTVERGVVVHDTQNQRRARRPKPGAA